MRKKEREINENTEIIEIIDKADVCRLAMIDNNEPYLVAMNFGYKPNGMGSLYFHCSNVGRKIDIIERNNFICFQMDVDHELISAKKACGFTMKFKSIVGYGKIYKVISKDEKIEGLNYIMKQYTGKNKFEYDDKILDKTTILRLDIDTISGKKKE